MSASPQHYDVFIIGGGPAGQHVARACKAAGMSVGITEYRGFGGTCGLRGCDPKRIMVSVTEAIDSADRLVGHGVAKKTAVDWKDMIGFVGSFVDPKPANALAALRELGIDAYTGKAHFTDKKALRIDDQETDITAEHIVIATGQRPLQLDIPGKEHYITSDDFHNVPTLPRRVVFIGGGYIGLESAHIMRRCGAEVTIVHNDNDPLAIFDAELSDQLVELTRGELGVEFLMNTTATGITKNGDGSFSVSAKNKDGKEQSIDADLVINTTGRVPNLEGLKLANAGIEPTEKGVPVDEFLRVKGAHQVYAIGDCGDGNGPPLTPVATEDAKALSITLTKGNLTKPNYTGLSTAVYSLPELAMVGLTETEAKEKGINFKTVSNLCNEGAFNARRVNARAYGHKVLINNATGKLVGAHIIGPRASEMINLFALALRANLDASILGEVPYAYPTWGGDVKSMVG